MTRKDVFVDGARILRDRSGVMPSSRTRASVLSETCRPRRVGSNGPDRPGETVGVVGRAEQALVTIPQQRRDPARCSGNAWHAKEHGLRQGIRAVLYV